MTLAWVLENFMFVFLACSCVESHTEKKKRLTGGWGHAVQWSMQMHIVGVLDTCSRTSKCSATTSHAVHPVP